MSQRTLRAGTRAQSVKTTDDVRRSMPVIDRVRHWEKKWVTVSETSLRLFKWVPVTTVERRKKDRKEMRESNKENKRLSAISARHSANPSAASSLNPNASDDSMSMTMNDDSNTATSFTSESQSQSQTSQMNGSVPANLSFTSRLPPKFSS